MLKIFRQLEFGSSVCRQVALQRWSFGNVPVKDATDFSQVEARKALLQISLCCPVWTSCITIYHDGVLNQKIGRKNPKWMVYNGKPSCCCKSVHLLGVQVELHICVYIYIAFHSKMTCCFISPCLSS